MVQPAEGWVMSFMVTEFAQRPARMDGTCFYCHQPIGSKHNDDCVLVMKTVVIRMTVVYEVDVPNHWDEDSIEFHRNESSWCASNAIRELDERFGGGDECMCCRAEFEFVRETERGAFLKEK